MEIDLKNRLTGYSCINCSKVYPVTATVYTCESCGSNLDAKYDYDQISSYWTRSILGVNPGRSIWRYLPLLPVKGSPENYSLQVGGTPLVDAARLAAEIGIKKLLVKDDTRNPSGSLKDRATEVGLQHASEAGKEIIVAASTGNAAASLAALSAFYGRKAVILAPASAPPAKLTQILQYGASLFLVDGNYDDAFELSLQVAEKYGWYSRSTGINPVLSEGKKTVALEIAEQMNWQIPDYVFVPVGDGCIIGGVYKGFCDLKNLGWIEDIPRIVAVQAEGSAAIVNALDGKDGIIQVAASTIADSISVDLPRDGQKAVQAVKDSGGFGLKVSDEEILSAQKKLASGTGIFTEPAAAAAFAGILKAKNESLVKAGDSLVVLATGSGLKDVPAAGKILDSPESVKPTIEEFDKFISGDAQLEAGA